MNALPPDPDQFRAELREHRGTEGASVCVHCGEPAGPDHCAALAKDAARYRFLLPIVTGDGDVDDARAIAVGFQLLRGLDGDAAIDAAMAGWSA